jgi:hypothetical protein
MIFNSPAASISAIQLRKSLLGTITSPRGAPMGYDIHIRRRGAGPPDSHIALSEWRAVVECTGGVRMAEGDYQITNPVTGERIRIRNRGGDAEVFFPDEAAWRRVFHWFDGRISFRAGLDFEVPTSLMRRLAGELARELDAQLVGDEGEIYD